MEKFHFEFVVTVWTGIIGRFTHPNSEIGLWFLLLNPPSHGETSKDRPHVTERCTDAVCQLSGSIGYERFHFLVDRFTRNLSRLLVVRWGISGYLIKSHSGPL